MYLSDLLGRTLDDPRGQRVGRLRDVVARVEGDGPPTVIGLLVARRGQDVFLPLAAVARLGPPPILRAGGRPDRLEAYARRPAEILLGRDVMDGQVIDLRRPRVVRVNDVALGESTGVWRLAGVDTGPHALLRRLLPRALRPRDDRARLLPWAHLELLASEVPGGGVAPDHRRLARLHPADIARVADAVPPRQASEIVAALPDDLAADTMQEMIDAKQADVLEQLDPARAADILDRMAPDDAADVLAELEPEDVDGVLRRMEPAEAADVHALLTYPKDTAGGLMTTDYALAPPWLVAVNAPAYLRPRMERLDWVHEVYVVADERERRLLGVVTLRDLYLADPARSLGDLMVPADRRVGPDAPASTVARTMSEYNLLALPVVDAAGRLLGVVGVDDALEIILPDTLRRRLPRMFR